MGGRFFLTVVELPIRVLMGSHSFLLGKLKLQSSSRWVVTSRRNGSGRT